jgi:hypothetical protein
MSAIVSLIDALAADSTTGHRRYARDSTLVNFKDPTLVSSEEQPDSLPPSLGVRVRHNWYVDCAPTDSQMSRVARAHCALREFADYIEIANFTPRGDSASAAVIVSRLAEQARDPRPWYRRLGGALATALGSHKVPNPPIWFRPYSVTFFRGSDGQWATVTLRPWQPIRPS